jgi:uncharacterized membrane protein YhdT
MSMGSMGTRERRRLPDDFEEDPRYRVSVKEAWIVLAYWLVFTVVVTAVAWVLGGNRSADEITFVLGFPAWFFWSGIVASLALSIVPIFLVRSFFTDLPLAEDPDAPAPAVGEPGAEPHGEGRG